jgi:hypothetical protein
MQQQHKLPFNDVFAANYGTFRHIEGHTILRKLSRDQQLAAKL